MSRVEAPGQALDHLAISISWAMAKERCSGSVRKVGEEQVLFKAGWAALLRNPFPSPVGQSCRGEQRHQERESWICKGCRMRKVFSGLASSSAQPVWCAGVLQDVGRTTELSGEDRTHLELLWTSPSKLVREESSPKDEVLQADGGYLMKTQFRRAKSFLRLITCLTCPTVANTSSRIWAGLCHASHSLRNRGSEDQMGKKNMETAPALAHEEHRQGLLMHHLA